MEINRITYSIRPAFGDESFFEISKNPRHATYSIFIKDGAGQRKIRVSEDRVMPLFDAIKQLCLPVPSQARGIDGVTYELTIGGQNRVTYSWWVNLPKEWATLEKIVSAIVAISGITKQSV